MKGLKESLFDTDIITRDLLDDQGLKKFLGDPFILWYVFQYWDMGEDEYISEQYKDQWEEYKPIIDYMLSEIDKINKTKSSWFIFTEYMDWRNNDDDEGYSGELYTTIANVQRMANRGGEHNKGTWSYRDKGEYIPNSQIRFFIEDYANRRWNLNWSGYILLTEGDSLMVMGFPKGINKKILKVFGIDY